MPGLAYDQILGMGALSNGIIVAISRDGVTDIAANLKQLSDLVSIGAEIKELTSDGVNTLMTIELEFSEPVILKANRPTTDFISVTISDNLSELLVFTGLARGAYEK